VRCLRDENPRADRGLEFTQLDVEMSFADEEDMLGVTETVCARTAAEPRGVEVEAPCRRMTFDEMLDRSGSDKADLRYGMELSTLTDLFEGSGFQAFARGVGEGLAIKG